MKLRHTTRLILIVVLLHFCAVPVFARPIDLVIVRDESEKSLAHCNIIQMAEYAESYFQQYGVYLRFTAYHTIKLSTRPRVDQDEELLTRYGAFARRHDFLRKHRLVHFVSGPLFASTSDGVFTTGRSRSTCNIRQQQYAFSFSSAVYENSRGEPRSKHALVAMLHEVAHYLGAEHDNSEPVTLMHAAPLNHVDLIGVPELSQKSLTEIYECIDENNLRH